MRVRIAARLSAGVLLLAAVALPVMSAPPAGAQDGDGAAREWNQVRGNAARTGETTLRPLRGDPQLAWSVDLPGPAVCEPVAWGGIVYAAAHDGRQLQLVAVEARSGKTLGTKRIGKGEWADLAVWQGQVIACTDTYLQGFPFRNGKLGNPWKKKGAFAGAPVVYQGLLIVRDGDELVMFDAVKGKELARTKWLDELLAEHPAMGYAMLGVATPQGSDQPLVVGMFRGGKTGNLHRHQHPIVGLGTRNVDFGNLVVHEIVKLPAEPDESDVRMGILSRLSDGPEGEEDAWLFTLQRREDSKRWAGSLAMPDSAPKKQNRSDIETAPAIHAGRAYGFAKDDTLFGQRSKGRDRALTQKGVLPKGAKPGAGFSAAGVVCFGNWAIEIATGRTLWCVPDAQPATAAVPIADGFVAFGTADAKLVCLAESGAIAAAAESGPAAEEGAEETADVPEPPPDGDGILLADGRKIEGTTERLKGRAVRIVPEDGEPFEVDEDDILLITADGEVELQGDDNVALELWSRILDASFVEALDASFESYLKARLVSDCRRVLSDARAYGMSPSRANARDASLVGKTDHPNAASQRKRLAPEEQELREAACEEVVAAVEWCRENEFPAAGAAVLEYLIRERPDDERIDELANSLVPEAFPWRDAPDAGRKWITWSKAIAPAGGRFLPKGHALWKNARNAPWDQDTILLRSRNVLLFSRSSEPEIVGMCLRVGEGTVRALEGLLGQGSTFKREILDVRLHKNRAEYLKEQTPSGGFAMPWSAGYYSPGERVSRFYVPSGNGPEPLGRGLSKTLSHEVTHHWIDRRWMGGEGSGPSHTPGYWVVEGMARFVEDQSMEMGRRAGRMDDTTVTSLDACSQAARKDKLQHTSELVDMTQRDFSQMPEKHVADVRLRNTLQGRRLDTRALFYEQSGSLVFFLMNRRGDEGRQALVDYMRRYYRGRTAVEGWRDLGFDGADDLHAKFSEFMKTLAE